MYNKLISFALPVYNEQKNLPIFYRALIDAIKPLSTHYDFEFIFVNDGSRDGSWDILTKLAASDSRISAINFSRNFGHQIALTAAYDRARGNAIISMDTDLQHPPALIPQIIQAWEQGAPVVYAQRTDRNSDLWLKKLTATWFYRIFARITNVDIPHHVADFRLIDRLVLNTIQQSKERSRFLRGLIAWTGLPNTYIPFKVHDRLHGYSAYTWKKMLKLALDGIFGFSYVPVKIPFFIGMLFSLCALVAMVFNAWTISLVCIGMSLQFFVLWLLGEYMIRIYDQLRGRPLYVVAETI